MMAYGFYVFIEKALEKDFLHQKMMITFEALNRHTETFKYHVMSSLCH